MELATYLELKVEATPELEMASSRMWTNVCFRYVGNTESEELNQLNAELRLRLLQDGRFMVSRSTIDGNIILRSVIANNQITEQTLDSYIDRVVELGRDIERGLPYQ